jgi:hypothetical protein
MARNPAGHENYQVVNKTRLLAKEGSPGKSATFIRACFCRQVRGELGLNRSKNNQENIPATGNPTKSSGKHHMVRFELEFTKLNVTLLTP